MALEKKAGLAFHCHHDVLYEFVYDYDERVKYIKEFKPLKEQSLRLKLFQLVPDNKIPGNGSPEWKAYDKARKAYDKAWKAYDKARKVYDKAWKAYDKAWEANDKARKACAKAWGAYDKAWGNQIKELHLKLCPDCPWDGSTIFTNSHKQ